MGGKLTGPVMPPHRADEVESPGQDRSDGLVGEGVSHRESPWDPYRIG